MINECRLGTLSPPPVIVLDAGEPPRRALRYEVEPPSAARFSATTSRPEAGANRTRRLSLLLEPKGPRCLAYRVTAGDGVRQGARAFGHLVVRSLGGLWLQRGFPEYPIPRDGALIMHESWLSTRALTELEDALLLLPEAPVGKGARWKSSRRIGRDGLEFLEKRTFTLEHASDETIEVTVTIEADAEPQKEFRDNYVGDRLVERHDRFSGKLVVRRGAPLPVGGWKGEERTRVQGDPERVSNVERTFDLAAPDR